MDLRLFWLALYSAALIALSGCGESATQTGKAGASAGGAASEVVLRRGNGAEPVSLDPHHAALLSEDAITGDLLMGLTTRDASGRPVAGVAERWDISADGKTWIFHLRDHQWSDGTPVTANDFVYSWRRMFDPKTAAPYASILYVFRNAQPINAGMMAPDRLGARAIDDRTLELELEHPAPYLPELVAHMTALPVPSHVVEPMGRNWTRPGTYVGNGPYVLAEWIPNDHITLVKNERFYDTANVKIDRVEFIPIAEAAGFMRFRAGELDVQRGIPITQTAFIEANMGSMLHKVPLLSTLWVDLNLERKPFDDIRVRQALNLAYDRETLANRIVNVGQRPAYSILPPGIANYPGAVELDFRNTPYAERLKRAQDLMRETGFGPDKRLRTTMAIGAGEDVRTIAAFVQEVWRNIYVDLELVQSDPQVHFANLRVRNFDIASDGWIADFNDPVNFLFLFLSDSSLNFSGYKNPTFDALFQQAEQELDEARRGRLLAQAEAVLLEDVPVIPSRHQVTQHLVQPYVKGWIANPANINRTRWLSIQR